MQFLYNNLLDSATLTASSAATGFPANNLKNPFRTKIWRTAGATAGTANLIIDLTPIWATTGSNLVSNGADWTGGPPPTGWTATNCTLAAVGGGQSGNCLEITRTAGAIQSAKQIITCVVGKLYRLHFYVHDGTNPTENFDVNVTGVGGASLVNCSAASSAAWDVWGYYYFVADQTSITVELNRDVNGAGTMLFDTIEVYEMTGASITSVALTGYNWASAPGTLDLEFSNSNSWGALATETLTWHITPTANGNKATIIKTFTEKNYPYARLNVVHSPGGTPTDWDLGRIFIGTYFQPTYNYDPQPKIDMGDESIGSKTIGGQKHFDEIEKFRPVSFSCTVVSQVQWELFQTMINTVGISKSLFVAFDYDNEPDEMTIYGHFTSLPGASGYAYAAYNLSFGFEEDR